MRASGGDSSADEGFTMNSHSVFGDVTARSFLELCLSENDRRLSLYDSRLLRPAMVPSAVRLALRFLPKNGANAPKSVSEGDETSAKPLGGPSDNAIAP
jgi:hypothetical protein